MSSRSLDALSPRREGNALQGSRGRSVLKRALLGLLLLFILVAGGAWLMHAGLEAEADGLRGAEAPQSQGINRSD